MTALANISAPVSFGLDVRRPGLLETRSTGDVLLGIQTGAWQDIVARVRSLPPDSVEQKTAKLALPYATWAGVFNRRANYGLVSHSGQIGVDLDDLGEAGAVAVLQSAVADRFCLAAFRSARGEGVRLISEFRHARQRITPARLNKSPNTSPTLTHETQTNPARMFRERLLSALTMAFGSMPPLWFCRFNYGVKHSD